ncbi:MAG: DMT family transporter [Alphaproteobacteria bacterium]
MGQWRGVGPALISSMLGGTAAAVTRWLAADVDPVAIAILRFGLGFLIVLPFAVATRAAWPPRRDRPAVAVLGIAFFAAFFVLYNVAMGWTTAARGSLALATLPLQTMVVGALLGVEPLDRRKATGVVVAVAGVALALASGLAEAPAGSWRGEATMAGAVLCMAFYNVLSRPFIGRSSAVGFLAMGMGAGAAVLVAIGAAGGSLAALARLDAAQWMGGLYLAAAGGALAFLLWVVALRHASPTRVAVTMTVNPVAAALLAAVLVAEPIAADLVAGLAAVALGIWIATAERRNHKAP